MIRFPRFASSLCFLTVLFAAAAYAQSGDPKPAIQSDASQQAPSNDKAYQSNRSHAFELYKENKFTEALPILEQLAAQDPKDAAVLETYGMVLLATSASVTDPVRRKQIRVNSRTMLLKAQALGDNSDLLQTLLQGIPEDGSTSAFSAKKEVDDAMREGESAFANGDLKKAISSYERAHLLDPTLYHAALFVGDCYFKLKVPDNAGLWFAEAIKINPDVETAYRYWGDSLLAEGKMNEARSKFIDAYVVAPYDKAPGFALLKWAKANQLQVGHPRIQSPNSVTQGKTGTNINVTVDSNSLDKKDGSSAWLIYDLNRAGWQADTFHKKFPNEKAYRHTLTEEVEGLGMVANSALEIQKSGKEKLNPALATLLKLQQDGLLSAFVLLAKADNGIAQDYPTYLKDHRDQLRKYMEDYVVPKPAEK